MCTENLSYTRFRGQKGTQLGAWCNSSFLTGEGGVQHDRKRLKEEGLSCFLPPKMGVTQILINDICFRNRDCDFNWAMKYLYRYCVEGEKSVRKT